MFGKQFIATVQDALALNSELKDEDYLLATRGRIYTNAAHAQLSVPEQIVLQKMVKFVENFDYTHISHIPEHRYGGKQYELSDKERTLEIRGYIDRVLKVSFCDASYTYKANGITTKISIDSMMAQDILIYIHLKAKAEQAKFDERAREVVRLVSECDEELLETLKPSVGITIPIECSLFSGAVNNCKVSLTRTAIKAFLLSFTKEHYQLNITSSSVAKNPFVLEVESPHVCKNLFTRLQEHHSAKTS